KVDLENILNIYENYLIKEKFLDNETGESYLKFYNNSIKLNDIVATIPDSIFNSISTIKPGEINEKCIQKHVLNNNSLKLSDETNNSKIFQLYFFHKNSNEKSLQINMQNVLNILDAKDFENPLYKT